MWKVSISNQSQNLAWEAKFATQELAQVWLNSQIGKPHRLPEREIPTYDENNLPILDEQGNPVMETLPAEFTSSVVDITASHTLAQEKADAQKYLDSTDWYIIRYAERAVAVPSEVTTLRLAAVAKLNE